MWCHNIVELLGLVVDSPSCYKTLVVLFDFRECPFFRGPTGIFRSFQLITSYEAPQTVVTACIEVIACTYEDCRSLLSSYHLLQICQTC